MVVAFTQAGILLWSKVQVSSVTVYISIVIW